MLYGTASKPEQITNTANLTRSHSWPIAKASRPTERQKEKKKRSNPPYTSAPVCISLRFDASPRDWAKPRKKKTSLQPHTTTQAPPRKQTRALSQNLLKSSLLISSLVLCKWRAARTKVCNLSCSDISDAGQGGSAETNVFCFPFSFLFFKTISTQNKSSWPLPLSLSFFWKWYLCSSAHISVSKNYAPLNKQRLETYPTTKTAGASAEKENHCCRYSVRATICFDCLSATSLSCLQSSLFAFACVFFFFFSETSSVSEQFKRMQRTHNSAQNPTDSCCLTKVCCYIFFFAFPSKFIFAWTPPETQRKRNLQPSQDLMKNLKSISLSCHLGPDEMQHPKQNQAFCFWRSQLHKGTVQPKSQTSLICSALLWRKKFSFPIFT